MELTVTLTKVMYAFADHLKRGVPPIRYMAVPTVALKDVRTVVYYDVTICATQGAQ